MKKQENGGLRVLQAAVLCQKATASLDFQDALGRQDASRRHLNLQAKSSAARQKEQPEKSTDGEEVKGSATDPKFRKFRSGLLNAASARGHGLATPTAPTWGIASVSISRRYFKRKQLRPSKLLALVKTTRAAEIQDKLAKISSSTRKR